MRTVRLSDPMLKAARRVINRLLVRGRKIGSQRVRAKYNIKAGDLNKSTILRRMTGRALEGQLIIRGRPLRVYYFGARQVARGTRIRIKKSTGSKIIRSAFIAEMPSGLIQVWLREGEPRVMTKGRYAGERRQPIRQLFTISPAKMFEVEAEQAIEKMVHTEAGPMFRRELQYYLGGQTVA